MTSQRWHITWHPILFAFLSSWTWTALQPLCISQRRGSQRELIHLTCKESDLLRNSWLSGSRTARMFRYYIQRYCHSTYKFARDTHGCWKYTAWTYNLRVYLTSIIEAQYCSYLDNSIMFANIKKCASIQLIQFNWGIQSYVGHYMHNTPVSLSEVLPFRLYFG